MDARTTLDAPSRDARRFGLLAVPAGLAGAALLVGLRTGSAAPALVAAPLAALSAAVAWLAPAALRPLHRAARRGAEAVSRGVAWVLLAAVYFTAFAVASLVARAVGYDAMRRRLDRAAPSYWVPRAPDPDSPERWFDAH